MIATPHVMLSVNHTLCPIELLRTCNNIIPHLAKKVKRIFCDLSVEIDVFLPCVVLHRAFVVFAGYINIKITKFRRCRMAFVIGIIITVLLALGPVGWAILATIVSGFIVLFIFGLIAGGVWELWKHYKKK